MYFLRLTAIAAYVIFALTLAVATVVEWMMGTSFINEYVYGTWWFAGLMGVLGVSGLTVAVTALKRNKPALLVHLALAAILVGALITKMCGVQGTMFLREGVRTDAFMLSDARMARMPMGLTLSSFDVVCYPGTEAPMDYRSVVMTDDSTLYTISMNKVLTLKGYRFYQSSYTAEGSVLSVNYDPFGIAVSYLGYALLALGLLLVLINPKGRFRTLLRELSVCLLPALLTVGCTDSVDVVPTDIVPAEEFVASADSLLMLYNDRIVPFDTYAIDYTLKLTGSRTFEGLSAEQFLLGWYAHPKQWADVACLRLKEPLPAQCGISADTKYVALSRLFDDEGRYLLEPYFRSTSSRPPESVRHLDERVQLIIMLTSGEALTFFPATADGVTLWQQAADNAELNVLMADFKYNLANAHAEAFAKSCSNIAALQRERGGESLPSEVVVTVEKCHNALRLTTWMFRLCLTFGLVLLIVNVVMLSRDVRSERLYKAEVALLLTLFVVQTVTLVMRAIVSGSLPMSTGYETMLFMAWALMLLTFVVRRLMTLVLPMGMLLAGFTLLVADIGMNNPHITPLMPVLHSPWLSSHVATIMMSYALFTLLVFNSVVGLTFRSEEQSRRMAKVSILLLYPALTLLTIGIFIGAVWANESWGRYWAWDPKEVWALITMLVYAVPLHPRLVPQMTNPKRLHIYLLCAFACVLMTYFGVNYLLGGIHSYGAQ